MKRLALLLLSTFLSCSAFANLMITAVYDGPLTGGVPKGVELYAVNDIPDLSIYSLGSANNGGGSDGEEFTFPAHAVLAGSFIYVSSEAAGFEEFFGFAPDYTSSAMSINGDDAIELFEQGVVIDLFGDINLSGSGEPWFYQDGWAYRASGTTASAAFNVADWLYSGANSLDGEINNQSALIPVPVASFITSGGSNNDADNVVINEVDADTEGTDVLEFIELFDGGAGNTSLTGLSIVLYNGSNNTSYNAISLDGYSTNANGYFVLGNPGVANLDLDIGASNQIQNGADAVALVQANAVDFPNGTPVTYDNVQDAIVYGTNDSDAVDLLPLLNAGQPQVNESANNGSVADSNQRCANGSGGQRNTDSYIQAAPTPGAENNCAPATQLQFISAIQGTPDTQGSNSFGDTDVSPLIGQPVIVEAVVVGDFQDGDADVQRNLTGFYLQEQTVDEDGDPSSSEGVFVYDLGSTVDVNVGDLVRVTGTVTQYFGETQIGQVTAVEILAVNQLGEVTPATISLATQTDVNLSQNGFYQPDLEAYEGMWVTFSDTLTISEQYQLDRFNEIKLDAGNRPVQFTQTNTPDAVLYQTFLQNLGKTRITYDDGLNIQNANIGLLDGFDGAGAGYNEANAKRMGDTITHLTGVLDYKWSGNSTSGATWRVRSTVDGSNQFTSNGVGNSPNPRPLLPDAVAGNVKVVSFNVLNFFTTLDLSGVVTAAGHDPRGADTQEEFDRQLQKTVNALLAIDADLVGLIEIENEFDATNDGSTAIEVLVNALNSALGANVYDYVYPGQQFVGTDAIAVAMIYKPGVVALTSNSQVATIDDTVAAQLPVFAARDFIADPIFNGVATNRVSLAASFTHLASNETFTVVANHFKSKGASGLTDGTSANFDKLDGAGFWNQRRLDAAVAIKAWLQTAPTDVADDDQIILGDLNAYAMEEPVQYLLGQGFNNVEDIAEYSYVFDGQVGTLDYVLISDALQQKFAGAKVWHINADEADALDYNLDFGKDASYFDAATATRNSDHDPLIAGFDFESTVITPASLLETFKAAVAAGDINGAGFHPVLQSLRVLQFYHLLDMANRFSEKGITVAACVSLKRAANHADGDGRSADWITGAGVAAMSEAIASAMAELGCYR